MKHLFILVIYLSLSGCISNIDTPAPAWWKGFSRNGATESSIRVALLECGSNVPGDSVEFSAPDGKGLLLQQQGLFQIVLVQRCMRNAGFPYIKDSCIRWKNLPACKPDALIPKRSAENRLNSPYCKIYSRTPICQPVVNYSKLGSFGSKTMPLKPADVPIYYPNSSPTDQQMNQLLRMVK